jgi:hypothetical protein
MPIPATGGLTELVNTKANTLPVDVADPSQRDFSPDKKSIAILRPVTFTPESMESSLRSNVKLAIYAGALAGPMSAVCLLVLALAGALRGVPVPIEPLGLLTICTVTLFFGVPISVVGGSPVFFGLAKRGYLNPLVVALWSALLGVVSYHFAFATSSFEWLALGAVASFLGGGLAALLVRGWRRSGRSL